MNLQTEKPILLDYLDENPPEMMDAGIVRSFYEAAQAEDHEGGNADVVYGLGLLLHQLVMDYELYPEMQQAPQEVQEQTHQQALAIFNKTAALGVSEGMKMVAWCNLMGFGTDADPVSAQIWFDEAAKHIDAESDIQMRMMSKQLDRHNAPPAGQTPRLN